MALASNSNHAPETVKEPIRCEPVCDWPLNCSSSVQPHRGSEAISPRLCYRPSPSLSSPVCFSVASRRHHRVASTHPAMRRASSPTSGLLLLVLAGELGSTFQPQPFFLELSAAKRPTIHWERWQESIIAVFWILQLFLDWLILDVCRRRGLFYLSFCSIFLVINYFLAHFLLLTVCLIPFIHFRSWCTSRLYFLFALTSNLAVFFIFQSSIHAICVDH